MSALSLGSSDAVVFNADDQKAENGREMIRKWMPVSVLVTLLEVVTFVLALPLLPYIIILNTKTYCTLIFVSVRNSISNI